jgi:hypothetical protein
MGPDHRKKPIMFQRVSNQLQHRLPTLELNYTSELFIFLFKERKKKLVSRNAHNKVTQYKSRKYDIIMVQYLVAR